MHHFFHLEQRELLQVLEGWNGGGLDSPLHSKHGEIGDMEYENEVAGIAGIPRRYRFRSRTFYAFRTYLHLPTAFVCFGMDLEPFLGCLSVHF
jgi:hypothetical protein